MKYRIRLLADGSCEIDGHTGEWWANWRCVATCYTGEQGAKEWIDEKLELQKLWKERAQEREKAKQTIKTVQYP